MKSKAVQQYVGLDVHKKSIQVAVMDKDGKVLGNTKISNKESEIKKSGKIQGRSIQAAAHIILDAKEGDDLQAVHRRHACEMNVIIIIVITVRTLICVKLVEGDPRFVRIYPSGDRTGRDLYDRVYRAVFLETG